MLILILLFLSLAMNIYLLVRIYKFECYAELALSGIHRYVGIWSTVGRPAIEAEMIERCKPLAALIKYGIIRNE